MRCGVYGQAARELGGRVPQPLCRGAMGVFMKNRRRNDDEKIEKELEYIHTLS
jgi:hypothetical protein